MNTEKLTKTFETIDSILNKTIMSAMVELAVAVENGLDGEHHNVQHTAKLTALIQFSNKVTGALARFLCKNPKIRISPELHLYACLMSHATRYHGCYGDPHNFAVVMLSKLGHEVPEELTKWCSDPIKFEEEPE